MEMERFIGVIAIIKNITKLPFFALAGIDLIVDPPRRWKLRVDKDYERRRKEQEEELEKHFDEIFSKACDKEENTDAPSNIKEIHLEYWDGDYKGWTPLSVQIDLTQKKLISDSWILGKEYKGSGYIGVALLTLPITLPLSPILSLINRSYQKKECKRGMSRHAYAFLKALEGQLDKETKDLLTEVFKNDWASDQEMRRIVTLEQAKDILRECKLVEHYAPAQIAPFQDAESRDFYWFDKRDVCVAEGSFCGQRDHYVRVFGSWFENAEADALVECYESKELIDYSEKEK